MSEKEEETPCSTEGSSLSLGEDEQLLLDDSSSLLDDGPQSILDIVDGTTDEVENYLKAVREESQLCGPPENRSPSTTRHTSQQKKLLAGNGKPRCSYLEHLLRLDGLAAHSHGTGDAVQGSCATLLPPTSDKNDVSKLALDPLKLSMTDATSASKDNRVEAWSTLVIQQFNDFRKHLQNLAKQYPMLSGEPTESEHTLAEFKCDVEQRGWDLSTWENVIQDTDVTLHVLGATDSVRAIAVLNSVAKSLCTLNRRRVQTVHALSKGDSSKITLQTAHSSFHADDKLLIRLLKWAFAALASVDALQAVDADVAYDLQVIRRCCRWIRSQPSFLIAQQEGPTEALPSPYPLELVSKQSLDGLHLVETLIVRVFQQC